MVGKEYLGRHSELKAGLGSRIRGSLLPPVLLLLSVQVAAGPAPLLPVPEDPGAALHLPPGFEAQVYARLPAAGDQNFLGPRFMAFGPDGHLYLSLGFLNKVVMLPDRDRDGVSDEVVTVADQLNAPQGLAFVDGRLLVANQDGVVRLEQDNGAWPAARAVPVIRDLPTGGHTMKSLRVGPDGHLYLNVGSSCNVCEESDPLRATLLRYTAEGRPAGSLVTVGRHAPNPIWAKGLRNAQGFAWDPRTGALYATNNGSDMRSETRGGRPNDDVPPEHLNRVEGGKHYGWPHCWGDRHTDPNFPGPEGFCTTTEPPVATFEAHSTPIGIAFLDRATVPPEYRGDALVALHGSWNREKPSGYKLVRVHFEGERPVRVSDFATGWLSEAGAWGRPVDIVAGPDGAMYVSDDRGGLVYRITYKEKTQ